MSDYYDNAQHKVHYTVTTNHVPMLSASLDMVREEEKDDAMMVMSKRLDEIEGPFEQRLFECTARLEHLDFLTNSIARMEKRIDDLFASMANHKNWTYTVCAMGHRIDKLEGQISRAEEDDDYDDCSIESDDKDK